jgi:hypothetical protein
MRLHVWNREPLESELANVADDDFIWVTRKLNSLGFQKDVHQVTLDQIKQEVNRELISIWNQLGDKEINGKPFCEWLQIEGQSFWHYYKYKGYFAVREWLYEIQFLEQHLNEFDEIIWYTSHKQLIDLTWPSHVEVIYEAEKTDEVLSSAISDYMKHTFKCFLKSSGLKGIQGKHLIINKSIPQNIWSSDSGQWKLGNVYLENVMQHDSLDSMCITDSDIPPLKGKKFVSHFSPNENSMGEAIFFQSLINPISVWHALQVSKKLKAIVNGLTFSEWTQTEKLIVSFLNSQVSSSAIYALKYNAWKKALRKNKPSSITLIDENSPLTRCVVDAARDCNVPTFAIQHGSIHDLHPAYMFSVNDQYRNVFPTFTLTWGEHWKNVLIEKGNYPKDAIYVSGQQRTDTIFLLIEKREQLRASLFQSNVPIVLFATQPQQDVQMRRRIAIDFFESLKSLPEFLGVLKLHPAEKNQDGFYLEIAKEVGCSNFKIQNDTDLYALITAADVVITAFSTVGTEAVYFRKPIVIWDPLNLDLLGLIKQDLAWGVEDVSDLSAALNRIVIQGERKEDVVFDRFIQQYAYKIDGNSSKRICDFIQSHSK